MKIARSQRALRGYVSARKQAGFSIVEIMVAVTLSIILLTGVIQIFSASKKSYRLQDELGFMQENARFAIGYLTDSIHFADHWGGVEAVDVDVLSTSITGSGGCNAAWLTNVEESIRGHDGAASVAAIEAASGFEADCIPSGFYTPNTDILVVRYADPRAINVTMPTAPTGPWVRSAVGLRAVVDDGTDIKTSPPGDLPDADGTYNYPLAVEIFYIRPCSVLTGGACTDGIPTLTRLAFNGNSLVAEGLVTHVEQLQFEYGVDADSDGEIDGYSNAAGVADWATVSAVRASVIIRADERDLLYQDTKTYNLPGGATHTVSGDANLRQFHRRQYTKTVQVRNRVRS